MRLSSLAAIVRLSPSSQFGMAYGVLFLLAAPICTSASPDILYILLDDYGWADAGWHRPPNYKDLQTPNMDQLVKEGVELDRHYAFKYCSPTRSAIQSGRNPIHVNVLNIATQSHNPKDPVSGFSEMPRNMTGIAEHLVQAGYETHLYGKWHAGQATPEQIPHGRGYQKSLCYLGGMNDYWTSKGIPCFGPLPHLFVDLWENEGPAHGVNNPSTCSQARQEGCVYEDKLFLERVERAIQNRTSKPFFIFWAPHIAHVPLQVPDDTLSRFSFIDDKNRKVYHSMVYWIDEAIGNVTKMLKQAGTWNNTLVIVHADNGGPIYSKGTSGANNYPLKGGKRSNWEGGIRVNAFVTGGFLPEAVRGTKQTGMMAAWDWFATVAGLAGVKDITDHRGAAAGLPPLDSFDMWPLITGKVLQSPRTELAIGDPTNQKNPHVGSPTLVGGLIQGKYKLIVGTLESAGWCGPTYPNSSSSWDPSATWQTCGNTTETGCLYDILSDPGEHTNLAQKEMQVFAQMLARMGELQKSVFSPDRGTMDHDACTVGKNRWGGFWGPWVDIDGMPPVRSVDVVEV